MVKIQIKKDAIDSLRPHFNMPHTEGFLRARLSEYIADERYLNRLVFQGRENKHNDTPRYIIKWLSQKWFPKNNDKIGLKIAVKNLNKPIYQNLLDTLQTMPPALMALVLHTDAKLKETSFLRKSTLGQYAPYLNKIEINGPQFKDDDSLTTAHEFGHMVNSLFGDLCFSNYFLDAYDADIQAMGGDPDVLIDAKQSEQDSAEEEYNTLSDQDHAEFELPTSYQIPKIATLDDATRDEIIDLMKLEYKYQCLKEIGDKKLKLLDDELSIIHNLYYIDCPSETFAQLFALHFFAFERPDQIEKEKLDLPKWMPNSYKAFKDFFDWLDIKPYRDMTPEQQAVMRASPMRMPKP